MRLEEPCYARHASAQLECRIARDFGPRLPFALQELYERTILRRAMMLAHALGQRLVNRHPCLAPIAPFERRIEHAVIGAHRARRTLTWIKAAAHHCVGRTGFASAYTTSARS